MISPLRRIAASLTGLAVGILFITATFAPSGADAQSTGIKRAAPPAKAHGKSAVRTPSSWVPNPAVNGKDAYLILDATSGRELVADRADELRHPASLTKLMTIYLTFSALDSGRLSLGDALPVSINALNAPPTKMGLPPGVHSYAILPIGYPMGRFGPVGRGPLKDVVYENEWGRPYLAGEDV